MIRRIGLAGLGLLAALSIASAQQGAFPNYPIVGGDAYCSSRTNTVCTNTVPAGPTAITGNEQVPANTELSNGQSPQNVLITTASLGKGPLLFPTASATPANVSPSNLNSGVIFTHSTTITTANVNLPSGAGGVVNGQTFKVSSNRTITTLIVGVLTGDSLAANSSPTTLTASTTGPQGYEFVCHKSGTACTWWRLQ